MKIKSHKNKKNLKKKIFFEKVFEKALFFPLIFKFISPKKTVEGYLGGIFFTNVSFVFFFYIFQVDIKIILLLILINLTVFISILGDLIESYFKRINKIKDSSNYLPGHGGFFDRFDSFIASIIMLTFISFIINL